MPQLFNYSTLNASLNPQTRSLTIELNRPEVKNTLNQEMLFELETIFAWVSNKVEVSSILLTAQGETFCAGIDQESAQYSPEKMQQFLGRLQKLNYALFHLPQTLIVDYKKGASNVGIELGLGADVRMAHSDVCLNFDYLCKGLVPCSGGLGVLGELIGSNQAKNWVLLSQEVSAHQLQQSGFLASCYDETFPTSVLKTLNQQSPLARIQTKTAFLQMSYQTFEQHQKTEFKASQPCFILEEWKEAIQAEHEERMPKFTPAKMVREILQQVQQQSKQAQV